MNVFKWLFVLLIILFVFLFVKSFQKENPIIIPPVEDFPSFPEQPNLPYDSQIEIVKKSN